MNFLDIDTTSLSDVGVLGVVDSHTFADGIDHQTTWPNLLEQFLYDSQMDNGHVYNEGEIGYNFSSVPIYRPI